MIKEWLRPPLGPAEPPGQSNQGKTDKTANRYSDHTGWDECVSACVCVAALLVNFIERCLFGIVCLFTFNLISLILWNLAAERERKEERKKKERKKKREKRQEEKMSGR